MFRLFCLAALAWSLPAQTFTTLYGFSGLNHGDGSDPAGNLAIDSHGVLYGATASGGAVSPGIHCSELGCGTVFSLTPPAAPGAAWTEKVLWSFGGPGDGSDPTGGVLLATTAGHTVLYGATYYGGPGSGFGNGTAFALTSPAVPGGAWTESLLWTFGQFPGDGINPTGGLVPGANGVLYGATGNGGAAGGGTVFSLTPPGSPGGPWKETILWNFLASPGDGAYPVRLVVRSGVLYGITQAGGANTLGTVFSLTPNSTGAWVESVLYSFTLAAAYPAGLTIASSGVLYGTTYGNQTSNDGTVFSLTPPGAPGGAWKESLLFSFPLRNHQGPYGDIPYGTLLIGSTGALYGTAEFGGSGGSGTIFLLKPPAAPGSAWTIAVLHNFNGSGGGLPFSGLVKDSRNVLYGTAGTGGPGNAGTVFSLIP